MSEEQQKHPSPDKPHTQTNTLYLHIPSALQSEVVSTVQSETVSQISWDYTVYERHLIPRPTVSKTNHNIRESQPKPLSLQHQCMHFTLNC